MKKIFFLIFTNFLILNTNAQEKEYYNNGNLRYECDFNNSTEKNGNCKYYHKDGKLKKIKIYENGKIISGKEFYSNGVISETQNYLTGETKAFYKNGNLFIKGNFINGERKGKFIEYYENGSIKSIETYSNGISINKEKFLENQKKEALQKDTNLKTEKLLTFTKTDKYVGKWVCSTQSANRYIEITKVNKRKYRFKDNEGEYDAYLSSKGDLFFKYKDKFYKFPIDKQTNEIICDNGCKCLRFKKVQKSISNTKENTYKFGINKSELQQFMNALSNNNLDAIYSFMPTSSVVNGLTNNLNLSNTAKENISYHLKKGKNEMIAMIKRKINQWNNPKILAVTTEFEGKNSHRNYISIIFEMNGNCYEQELRLLSYDNKNYYVFKKETDNLQYSCEKTKALLRNSKSDKIIWFN